MWRYYTFKLKLNYEDRYIDKKSLIYILGYSAAGNINIIKTIAWLVINNF